MLTSMKQTSNIKTRKGARPAALTTDVATVASILGTSCGAIYVACRRGEIKYGRLGSKYLIPKAEVQRLLRDAGVPVERLEL